MPGTAFFDLDLTITRQGTWSRFVTFAVDSRSSIWLALPAIGLQALAYKAGFATRDSVKTRTISLLLEGRKRRELEALALDFAQEEVRSGLRQQAQSIIDAHASKGDRLIMATAAADLVAEPIAKALGFDDVISTKLKWSDDDRLLAELDGKNCYGEEKLKRIETYCKTSECPAPVTAYSDHVSDMPMLSWADYGVAVNPSRPLLKASLSNGFDIANWNT